MSGSASTVFTKNRDGLLAIGIAAKFFLAVLGQSAVKAMVSDERCSIDGTLLKVWPRNGSTDGG